MAKDKIESLDDLIRLVRGIKKGDISSARPMVVARSSERGLGAPSRRLSAKFSGEGGVGKNSTRKPLGSGFRVESAGLIEGSHEHDKLYFLEQRYGLPTRLLDWTTNPLAALFVACSEREKVDGALFFMDAYDLAVTQNTKDKHYQGVVTMRHPAFQKALNAICAWAPKPQSQFPDFIMAFGPTTRT